MEPCTWRVKYPSVNHMEPRRGRWGFTVSLAPRMPFSLQRQQHHRPAPGLIGLPAISLRGAMGIEFTRLVATHQPKPPPPCDGVGTSTTTPARTWYRRITSHCWRHGSASQETTRSPEVRLEGAMA